LKCFVSSFVAVFYMKSFRKTETALEIEKKIDNETSILANERAIT